MQTARAKKEQIVSYVIGMLWMLRKNELIPLITIEFEVLLQV